MNEMTLSAPMTWATLAHLADGPDPLLSLIVKMSDPQTVIGLIRNLLEASGSFTSDQWQNAQSFRTLTKLLRDGYNALGIAPNRDFSKRLLERCKHWISKLRNISTKSNDEITDFLTYHGRFHLLTPNDKEWPFGTDDLLLRARSASPLCLWIDGSVESLATLRNSVGIVGSREADDYGLQCAHELGSRLASQGKTVVSGGALGIDASAHWGAMSTGFGVVGGVSPTACAAGSTVAFFAGGLRHIGPSRNFRLFDEIIAHGGALVSELSPDTVPYAARFLARNRLIAAVSEAVVLAQARHRSGAINTAQWAAEMGRIVLAIPGAINSPMNAGCNRLIAEQKAAILTSINDIDNFLTPLMPEMSELTLDMLNDHAEASNQNEGQSHSQTTAASLEEQLSKVLSRSREISHEALIVKLSHEFEASQIHQALGLWELNGKIQTNERGMITLTKH